MTMASARNPKAAERGERRRSAVSRREGHRVERREALLDAATEVVRRLGPATTMEAVAAEVGVAKPVLYRYFGDRSGLFAALADRFARRLLDAMAGALARDLGPRQLLEAGIDTYVGILEADPQLYRFVTSRPGGEAGATGAVLDEVVVMLARLLGDRLRAAGRDTGRAEVWAAGVVGTVHVATDRWLSRPVPSRAAFVAQLAELLWDGLAGASGRDVTEAAP